MVTGDEALHMLGVYLGFYGVEHCTIEPTGHVLSLRYGGGVPRADALAVAGRALCGTGIYRIEVECLEGPMGAFKRRQRGRAVAVHVIACPGGEAWLWPHLRASWGRRKR